MIAFSFDTSIKNLAVDLSESYIYLGVVGSPMTMIILNSADGILLYSMQ